MSKKEIGIKPLGARVVIQPLEEENRTDSGLYIHRRRKDHSEGWRQSPLPEIHRHRDQAGW